MISSLRQCFRNLFRRPGFSLAVIVTLALGIGANSAMFSVIDAVLLKPLPYPEGERLLVLQETNAQRKVAEGNPSPAKVEEWQRLNHTFDGIAGAYTESVSETSGALPEKVVCGRVSPRFFGVAGALPLRGRWFVPEEDLANGPSVAVLRASLARRRFGTEEAAVGKTVRIGAGSYAVVGVMADTFALPAAETEMWTPAAFQPSMMQSREARFYSAIGRLRTGVTAAPARADLLAVQGQIARQFPAEESGWGVRLEPLRETTVGGVRRSLWILFSAVSLLLLIACGNVACLFLVRARTREREFAIRFSLGANRRQVLGQLLLEGLVLALLGCGAGLLLASWSFAFLQQGLAKLPQVGELHIDGRLVIFTLVLSGLTTLLFALAPALLATRREVAESLAQGTRTQTGGRQRTQQVLVGMQMALTIVLLVGAGLFLRSFFKLTRAAPGFNPEHVLAFRVSASWGETVDRKKVEQRLTRTLHRLRELPGVTNASTTTALPGAWDTKPSELRVIGRNPNDPEQKVQTLFKFASADYLRVMQIPLLAGTACPADADPSASRRMLINRQFAERYFPGQNAVGQRLGFVPAYDASTMEIAGITEDTQEEGYRRRPRPVAYGCGISGFNPDPYFLVRTQGDPQRITAAVREAMREVSPTRAVYNVQPLTEQIAATFSDARTYTVLLGLFGGTALLLAGVGLYGVMSYFVSQRTREIGLRMALGARPREIIGSVLRQGAGVTGVGVLAGLSLSLALSKVLAALLVGVSPRDGVTFLLVPVLLMLVAGLAAWLPARRAARVDPMVALREE